jgi:hypothetical protein
MAWVKVRPFRIATDWVISKRTPRLNIQKMGNNGVGGEINRRRFRYRISEVVSIFMWIYCCPCGRPRTRFESYMSNHAGSNPAPRLSIQNRLCDLQNKGE